MKIDSILRIVAMIFIVIVSILLISYVFNLINSDDARKAIIKIAAVCGIIAASAMALSFVGYKKS